MLASSAEARTVALEADGRRSSERVAVTRTESAKVAGRNTRMIGRPASAATSTRSNPSVRIWSRAEAPVKVKRPRPSVVASSVVPSGIAAVTVAPGTGAPDTSKTTPLMVACCAAAAHGPARRAIRTAPHDSRNAHDRTWPTVHQPLPSPGRVLRGQLDYNPPTQTRAREMCR